MTLEIRHRLFAPDLRTIFFDKIVHVFRIEQESTAKVVVFSYATGKYSTLFEHHVKLRRDFSAVHWRVTGKMIDNIM